MHRQSWLSEVAREIKEKRAASKAGMVPEEVPIYECERCQDKGAYPVVDNDGIERYQLCECRERKRQQRIAERAREQLRAELGKFALCSFESFDTKRVLSGTMQWGTMVVTVEQQRALLHTAVQVCREYAETFDGWLWLAGSVGTGKTHLAAAIMSQAAERGVLSKYVVAPDVLALIRGGYATGQAEDYIDELKNIELLWIDDIGVEKLTEWVEETLYRIVNYRMMNEKPTIFTSNIRLEDMPGRIASRIIGNAQQVWLVASDYRREVKC
jgi:DNA replication protein DnaC